MTATAAMLDGVKEACEAWGRAMRWVLSAQGEGYPSVTSFQRAREGEMDANAQISLRQRFGEVMLGDALAVALAIRREPVMPEDLHLVVFMQYVIPHKDAQRKKITIRQRAIELGYTEVRAYYTALDNAHHFLLGRIHIDVPRVTSCAHNMNTLCHA